MGDGREFALHGICSRAGSNAKLPNKKGNRTRFTLTRFAFKLVTVQTGAGGANVDMELIFGSLIRSLADRARKQN